MQRTYDILLVENDSAIRAFIAEALSDEGCTIRAAQDIETALASMRQHPPHLVLLDLHLPGDMATHLLAELQRNRAAGPRVVAMTTNIMAAEALSGQGIAYCLTKPFMLDELLGCIVAHIR